MKSWVPMIAGGAAAMIGGLFALINPTGAAVTTVTLAGWVLLIFGAFQGWAAWKSETQGGRIRAGAIAAATIFLGLLLLLGNPAESWLIRTLVGLLLIASGAAKIYASRVLGGSDNMPLVLGAGAVSVVLGLVIWFSLNLNFGTLIGIELLASGLALVLLGMHRRRGPHA